MKRKMTWILAIVAIVCMMSVSLVGCQDNTFKVSIDNKSELTAEWFEGGADRTVKVSFSPAEFTEDNTEFTVKSSDSKVVSVNGTKLSAKGAGTATITVTSGEASDTVDITVVATAPTIKLGYVSGLQENDDGYLLGVMEGTEATIPNATAKTWDGKDVTVTRTADERLELNGDNVTADKGVYTITYTAVDTTDSTVVTTVTLKFVSARKIFAKTDGTFSITNELDEDSKQNVTVNSNGFQNAQFNIAASKLYYAEATFNVSGPGAENLVGLAHFVPTDVNGNKDYTRWLASVVDRGNRDHRVVDFDTSHAWSVVDQATSYYQWRLAEYRGLPDNDAGKVTWAIARVGDYFYTFVNGAYVDCVTLEHYRNNDTLPGIFGLKMHTSTIGNIILKIV